MAKASRHIAISLTQDVETVVTYINAVDAVDADAARAALARRIDDEAQFKTMQLAAQAAWVFNGMARITKGYTSDRATACVNGTLKGADSKAPDDQKRTANEESAYATARSNWRHLLTRLGVKSKDAKAGNKNAQRTPSATPPASPEAPISLAALTVPRTNTVNDLDTVFGLLAAWVGKLQNANADHFTGDKGAIYRDLAAHIKVEVARASAIAE